MTTQSHTVLLALDVVPTETATHAMLLVQGVLARIDVLNPHLSDSILESWHWAEDDRTDRSDCQSAVFCLTGHQAEAHEVLVKAGLA